jgi:L-galactose dehydrogenase
MARKRGGQAIRNCRDKIIVSTKVKATLPGASYEGADFVKRGDITRSVEKSLRVLATDHIDLIHLHGVRPHHYEFCLNELLPELLRVRDAGKVRFLGLPKHLAQILPVKSCNARLAMGFGT